MDDFSIDSNGETTTVIGSSVMSTTPSVLATSNDRYVVELLGHGFYVHILELYF